MLTDYAGWIVGNPIKEDYSTAATSIQLLLSSRSAWSTVYIPPSVDQEYIDIMKQRLLTLYNKCCAESPLGYVPPRMHWRVLTPDEELALLNGNKKEHP